MTEEIEKDYIFHFFDKDSNCLDETSLDENNPTHALYLFKEEFGWGNKDGSYVELVEFEDPTLYEDPDNFELSCNVREDGRELCVANTGKDLEELKTCPIFDYEEDYDELDTTNVVCKYCWGIGFKSVCERKPKEVK